MPSFEIAFTDKFIPDAYHGTSKANAEDILREGFKASFGDKQYLGDGVYFFEASRQYAVKWSKERRGLTDDNIAVIHAIINLGRCLDLHAPEHTEFVGKFAAQLQMESMRRTSHGRRPPLVITDALVINFIAKQCSIDTVRASRGRSAGRPRKIFSGSHFYEQELIICVRNLKNILRIKLA